MPIGKARWRVLCAALAFLSTAAHAGEPENAWEALRRHHPAVAATTPATEKSLLEALTPQQATELAQGADPGEITLADGSSLAELLAVLIQGGSFDLSWYTLDGGGGTSIGGNFRVNATIGQADAGVLMGGDFVLTGGFQRRGGSSGAIFHDGFESGDVASWSRAAGRATGPRSGG